MKFFSIILLLFLIQCSTTNTNQKLAFKKHQAIEMIESPLCASNNMPILIYRYSRLDLCWVMTESSYFSIDCDKAVKIEKCTEDELKILNYDDI